MKTISRRQFIKASTVGSLLSVFSSQFLPLRLFPQLHFGNGTDSILLCDTQVLKVSEDFIPYKGIKNEYPCCAKGLNDLLWICWTRETEQGEEICLRSFLNKNFGNIKLLSQRQNFAFQPEILFSNNSGFVTWAAFKSIGNCDIWTRNFNDKGTGELIRVSSGNTISWKPAITRDSSGNIWFVWEEKIGNHFGIKARIIKNNILSDIITVSKCNECDSCRPAIIASRSGNVWIAYDKFDGLGNINVILQRFDNTGKSKSDEIAVTQAVGLDVAPALTIDGDGLLWIAWHSNRWEGGQCDIPRWFHLIAFKEDKNELNRDSFYEPINEPLGKSNEKSGTVQSFEFIQLHCTRDGKVCITGRASHNFFLQYYKGRSWSPIYRLPKDGWGGRGQYLKVIEDREGDLWTIRRDLNNNILQKISLSNCRLENVKMNKSLSTPVLKRRKKDIGISNEIDFPIPNAPEKIRFEQYKDFNFYFGDIHGHSWMSDGVGDIDEYYITRRDYYKLDFASLTDHDTFVGNRILPSEWEQMKEMATHFNDSHRFVTIFGQEWTTARYPKAFGHKNIYHMDDSLPLYDHTDEANNHTKKLFKKIKNIGAIAIPHHIGWTGVDWENHDPVAQPLVEIISVHGAFEFMGNKPIPHRGGKKDCFVQDGLARGLRFGIVGGSDSHGLIWHHRVCYKRDPNRAGWTCVLAEELTRNSVFNALKERRCYATSGIWARIVFEINGHIMGDEFQTYELPQINVDIIAESELKWIEVIRNNSTIYQYGGKGYHSRFTLEDIDAPKGKTSYYYIRLTCEDGNMAWTSPIWVNIKVE